MPDEAMLKILAETAGPFKELSSTPDSVFEDKQGSKILPQGQRKRLHLQCTKQEPFNDRPMHPAGHRNRSK